MSFLLKSSRWSNAKNAVVYFFTDKNLKKLVRDSSWLYFASVVTSILGFFQAILVARLLGASNYGMLALIIAYVSIINQLVDFRVWETVTKYLAEFWVKEDKARALATVKCAYLIDFFTGVLAFLIVISSAPLVAKYIMHQHGAITLIRLYTFSLLFRTVNGTSTAILRVFDKFSWLSLQSIFVSTFKFILVVTVFFLRYGIKSILAIYLISEAIGGLIFVVLAFNVINKAMREAYKKAKISLLKYKFREMASILLHTNLTAFLKMAAIRIDEMLLGYFKTNTEVGYYKLAKTLVLILGKVSNPIYSVIYPEIVKLWSVGSRENFKIFLKKVTLLTGIAVLPLALGIFIFAPLIIKWAAGQEFLASTTAVRIMIWGEAALLLPIWARPAAVSMSKAYISNLGLTISALLWPIGSFILMPSWGTNGAAIIHVISNTVRISFVVFLVLYYIQKSGPSISINA